MKLRRIRRYGTSPLPRAGAHLASNAYPGLTNKDWDKYRLPFDDMIALIVEDLETLDAPYSYQKRREGKMTIFTVLYGGEEIGEIPVSPDMPRPQHFHVDNPEGISIIELKRHTGLYSKVWGKIFRDITAETVLRKATKTPTQTSNGEPTANQVEEEQGEVQLGKESKRNRILGLRRKYVIGIILLAILISIVSLFLFPDWGLSILALVILFLLALDKATSFIANFRKATE